MEKTINLHGHNSISVKVVTEPTELIHVFAVRSICFMEEKGRTAKQAFDGNDYQSTHIVMYCDNEPIGCSRIRWFSDFARIEKTALRSAYRQTSALSVLGEYVFNHIAMKGYRVVTTAARPALARLWRRTFGFVVNSEKASIPIDGLEDRVVELIKNLDVPANAIKPDTATEVLMRIEGFWDAPTAYEPNRQLEAD